MNIRVEHLRDALGIGTDRPRLSWIVETDIQAWHQAGYEIEEYDVDGKLLNQTGHVESGQSVLIAWPFAPLTSRESEPVVIEMGLLSASDWTARFISPSWEEDTTKSCILSSSGI